MNKFLLATLCLLLILPACVSPAGVPALTGTPVEPGPTAPPAPTFTPIEATPTTQPAEPSPTTPPSPDAPPTPACFATFIPLGFSSDGSQLLGMMMVEGQFVTRLQAFDLSTQSYRTIFMVEEEVTTTAVLAPDGQSVAWAFDDFSIRQVSTSDGTQLAAYQGGHTDMINALVFAPDGSRLYSAANDGAVIAWDTAKQQLAQRFEPPGVDIPTGQLGLGISPNGQALVVIPYEGNAKSWDTRTFQQLAEYPGAISGAYNGANAVYSPDGQYLMITLAAGPGSAALWRVADGEKLWSGGIMNDSAFSPDGKLFAHVEPDFNNSPTTIVLTTPDAQTVVGSIKRDNEQGIWKLFFTPDSTQLVVATGSQLAFYNVADGRLLRTVPILCP